MMVVPCVGQFITIISLDDGKKFCYKVYEVEHCLDMRDGTAVVNIKATEHEVYDDDND